MEITHVDVKLVPGEAGSRLRAFCNIEIDKEFLVTDLKVIAGDCGLFVAMPNRRVTTRCSLCKVKVECTHVFCHNCGVKLSLCELPIDKRTGKQRKHLDVCHPITFECRDYMVEVVLKAFKDAGGSDEPIAPGAGQ